MQNEHVLEFSRPDIDGNVIRAVKVIGLRSKHGWVYSPDVLKEAMPLYEASPVFIEHPDAKEKAKGHRQLGDHFGSLENIRGNGQGLFADLKIRQAHPLAKAILEAAPTARFGLSHNAVVDLDDKKTTVQKIVAVNSVDLVNNPATTENLFEGEPVPFKGILPMGEFEEKVLLFMEEIETTLKAQGATLVTLTESAPGVTPPETPPQRLIALEEKEGDGKELNDSHNAFLARLRGF